MTSILIGILGVIGPIIWDYYKTTSAVEVRVTGKSTIISKLEKMDGLLITYGGETLEELSKINFSVVNSGRTPILKKDVASPISIKFAKEANVIDVKLEAMQPPDLGATLQFNKNEGMVEIGFPLLNPNDKIDFSILAKTSEIKFDATGRIAGISSLTVKDLSQEKAKESRPLAVYPVGFFSALLAVVSFIGLFTHYPAERRLKLQIRNGTFELPPLKTKYDWSTWVNTVFFFTVYKDRKPLHQLINALPNVENLSTLHREEIMNGVQSLLERAANNLRTAIFILIIAAAGGWYVFSNF